MWQTPILGQLELDVVRPLVGLAPSELAGHYQTKARWVSGNDNLVVEVALGCGAEADPPNRLQLDPAEDIPSCCSELDRGSFLESQFWHELGHVMFSAEFPRAQEGRSAEEQFAAQLLEEVRMEARLMSAKGDAVRPWLRQNLLGRRTVGEVHDRMRTEPTRWTILLCGRRHAGVISDAESQAILEAAPRDFVEHLARDLDLAVEAYSSICDDALDGAEAAAAIRGVV